MPDVSPSESPDFPALYLPMLNADTDDLAAIA